ncbi:hypothetical protein PFICI_14072 [Pestalotiopsis fici W106-1]|uniref:Ankyrin repeat protein n=1 Tax=Pestalotiopsis fici (strain W106-1 / CGMCC3.15140) TaxID=1229662 RepID=W3WN14_PESFW|nr:uncharacterized protein PFICI_14072 [Pestalotiopsis fici W106-1]ETS74206.1 hypothetical protein PFICI_14072 [Pestalotiopsis fici W106-1]
MNRSHHRSCLSAEPHEENIKEVLLHFLGCLKISERHDFLEDEAHPVWSFEAKHNKGENVTKKREKWRANCLNELRRIEFLREKLKDDGDEDERQLVSNIERSRKEWKRSPEYKEGIQMVEEWRRATPEDSGTFKPSGSPVNVKPESVQDKYIPEKDVNVPIIKFKDGEPDDFKLDKKNKKIWGSFPDQKTTVEHLLDNEAGKNSILRRDEKDTSTVKYFHLPSNNMAWAEEAIARYFNEETPKFYKIRRKIGTLEETISAKILKESHWRGQLHGSQLSVNSRFMRPFCEAISSSQTEKDHLPKNMVLFMPYLHWETSRNREKFAQKIEQIVDQHLAKATTIELNEKKKRQEARKSLPPAKSTSSDQSTTATQRMQLPADKTQPAGMGRILTLGTLAQRFGYPRIPVKVDGTGRLRITYEDEQGNKKGSPLGQYLIDAARLFEAITNYRDKRLLEKFLMHEAPLHPRRTLDQAYYWTLNTTRSRDKDQVVYRATTAKGAEFHKYDFDKASWPNHPRLGKHELCRDCSDKITKVSRVVMVDQLWMWILDANTIITCFPKRYGANKHDSSGVHKSIRTRIGDKRHQQVKSVFDLALIIFEECSNTFFDRTRTTDKQPEVLDAFSESIGNIMHKQTLAFGRLWRWTEEARKIYKSRTRLAGSKLHVPLLDITPEGELEKEIKDILEELGIMIHINKTHRDVLKQFITHVKHILDPHSEFTGKEAGVDASKKRIGLLRKTSANKVPKFSANANEETVQEQKNIFDWFNINADETRTRVDDRIEQLEELQRSAQITASSVKDLLELKQQQAGVVQAWQSVRQSDEANAQGRAIMVFTIVTIVFLPLSFMSSLFGMNTIEFGGDGNLMHLGDQFRYIAGISAPIIFLTLVFSLNSWTRSALAGLFKYSFLWLSARIGLYQHYLDVNLPSHNFYEDTVNATEELLVKQMKLYSDRRWEKYEQKREASGQPSSTASAPGGSQSGGNSPGRTHETAVLLPDGVARTASRLSARSQPRPAMHDDIEAARRPTENGAI